VIHLKKKCKHCQTQIDADASRCPKCHGDLRNWFKRHPILTIILGLFFLGSFMSGVSQSSKDQKAAPGGTQGSTNPQKNGLEVKDIHADYGEFNNRFIYGTVVNHNDRQYSHVQVEFNLYDEAGNQVGSTIDNINNLEAGGSWKFAAVIIEPEAVNYKLKDVSGW